jgi:putative transcriptional regulator
MSRGYNFIMNYETKRTLGLNIKIERMRKDYTQEKLAEALNISVSHISKIEQGITSPTAYLLFRISKILNVQMEDFFKGITN